MNRMCEKTRLRPSGSGKGRRDWLKLVVLRG